MEIFISIDGVLRNTIQKFDYHYKSAYLDSEFDNEKKFEYSVGENIRNDNLLLSHKFQSVDEFEYFLFIEYPIEIFGHAGLSYSNVITELNKIIYDNQDKNFTIVGCNELGKSKPASLFFLSKNGFLGNNVKFIKTSDIEKMWQSCDMWITDNEEIIKKCPDEKICYKFNTEYNKYFTYKREITKLNEIEEIWLKSLENHTTSTSTLLQKSVEQESL